MISPCFIGHAELVKGSGSGDGSNVVRALSFSLAIYLLICLSANLARCLYPCLPARLPDIYIYIYIYILPVCQSVRCTCPFACLYICPSCLSVCEYPCLPARLPDIYLPACLPVCLPAYLANSASRPAIHRSIQSSSHLSIRLFIFPSCIDCVLSSHFI